MLRVFLMKDVVDGRRDRKRRRRALVQVAVDEV